MEASKSFSKKKYNVCKLIQPKNKTYEPLKQIRKKNYLLAKTILSPNSEFPKLGSLEEDLSLNPSNFLNNKEHIIDKYNNLNRKFAHQNYLNLLSQTFQSSPTSNKKAITNLESPKTLKIFKTDLSEAKKKVTSSYVIPKILASKKFEDALSRINSTQKKYNSTSKISVESLNTIPKTDLQERVINKYQQYKLFWNRNKDKMLKYCKQNSNFLSVMDRQEYFREKKELLGALELTFGEGEIRNNTEWQSALRKNHYKKFTEDMYVAIGQRNNPLWMKILDSNKGIIDQKIRSQDYNKNLINSLRKNVYLTNRENQSLDQLSKISPSRFANTFGLELKGLNKFNLEYSSFQKMKEPIEIEAEKPSIFEIENSNSEEMISYHFNPKFK